MLASTEITRHDHSIIACSRHMHVGVNLRAHPVRGEPRIQRNASGEVVTLPLKTEALLGRRSDQNPDARSNTPRKRKARRLHGRRKDFFQRGGSGGFFQVVSKSAFPRRGQQ